MKSRNIRVMVNGLAMILKGVVGPEGLVVATLHGRGRAEELYRETKKAALERVGPRAYSPFRAFVRR